MSDIKVGDRVRCIKGYDVRDFNLKEGEVYLVREVTPNKTVKLDRLPHYWDFGRFENLGPTPRLKAGDWVECIIEDATTLKKGQLYQVEMVHDDFGTAKVRRLERFWSFGRFAKVEGPDGLKVGDKVECIDASHAWPPGILFLNKSYRVTGLTDDKEIRIDESGLSWRANRFVKTFDEPKPKPVTDLMRLKDIFTAANVKWRSYPIRQYINKKSEAVDCNGFVLYIGAEDDGPYTELLFNERGDILIDGISTVYHSSKTQQFERA